MFRLLIKLAIAGLLANAVYRVGSEYLVYVKFRDAVRDAAMFKATTDVELQRRIMELAFAYDVPLSEDAIAIRREDRHVLVDGSYQKPIEVAPTFFYPWGFSWSIDALTPTNVPLVPPKP